jgi:vacuolar-type H+-ATPase subunit D/Vma8
MQLSSDRSRLFELRRDRAAAHRSAELLEHKCEVLLRELSRKTAARDALRRSVASRYETAYSLLRVARVEAGPARIASAALAQTLRCRIERRLVPVMGVSLVELDVTCEPFRAGYGAAGTTESTDVAGASFAALVPDLCVLAARELTVRRLRLALRKATKLLNALRKVVVPRIEHDIRAIVDGLEEEERDEAVRRRFRDHSHR